MENETFSFLLEHSNFEAFQKRKFYAKLLSFAGKKMRMSLTFTDDL